MLTSNERKFVKRKLLYLEYELQMTSDTENNKRNAIKADIALCKKLLSPLSLSQGTISLHMEDSWKTWTSGQA